MAIIGQGRVGIRSIAAPPATPTIWNTLTHYYTGDNTPNDAKGTANGTLTNGATYGTGKINNGLSFDGVNDYVTLPSNSTNLGTSFTVSAWIYRTSSTALQTIYSNIQNSPFDGFLFHISNDRLTVLIRNSGTASSISSVSTLAINTWYHVSVVVNSTNLCKGYVNNSEVFSFNPSVNVNYPTTTYPTIGAYKYGSTVGDVDLYFPGTIDELSLFNSALSTTQLTELYNSGNGKQYPN